MGLLDEAIREHLELKRRRGADPTEVSRQESEALGPVRREPDPGTVPDDEEPLAYEEEPGPVAYEDEPLAGDEPYADPLEEPYAEPVEEPPPAAGAPYDAGVDVGQPTEMMEPPAPPAPPPPEPPAAAGQEAEEWGFDDEPEAAEEPEEPEEDVLEETPEFLQETPEHDRLWFEQKPPRDFDFDG